jgi:hypothetical protein
MTDAATPARPPFEPLNELERLLTAAGASPAGAAAFEAALLDSPLWCALPAGADPTAETVTFLTVTPPGGRPATALFTARERVVTAYGPEVTPASWTGRLLLSTVRGKTAVLNPGQGYGAIWTPEMIGRILGEPVAPPSERYPTELARPADTPAGLVEGLTRAFAADPAVHGAWLALAKWRDGDDTGFFLDVQLAEGAAHIPALMADALKDVDLDARLDVATRAPGGEPGKGLEIVAAR